MSLAGDISGTNTHLAITDILRGHYSFLAEEAFLCVSLGVSSAHHQKHHQQ